MKPTKLSKSRKQEQLWGYLFILPWLVGFAFFWLGPIIASFFLSFFEWPILASPKWTGIENYQRLIADPLFWRSLKVTITYIAVVVPGTLIFGFFSALLLNQKLRGLTWFRTIFYAPVVVSGVIMAVAWLWLLDPDVGFVNYILRSAFGVEGPRWVSTTDWALPSIIILSFWRLGTTMVIFLAGLQGIPNQLYEAAEIDGAGKLAQLFHIMIPMLSPVILFNIFMLFIESFQVFTPVYVMTGGGPHYATLLYVLYFYEQGFVYLRLGYASTLAWVFFLLMLLFTVALLKTSRHWVYYLGEES